MSHRPLLLVSVLDDFLASARFRGLAESTRREYERVAYHLRNEIGGVHADQISRRDIRLWRDAWAHRGYRACGMRLQVLSNALDPLVSDGVLPSGLFGRLLRLKRPHGRPEPNPVWEDEEVAVVIAGAIENKQHGLARAIALGRYAGLRKQTILVARESHRHRTTGPDGKAVIRLQIHSQKGEELVDIPEDGRLTQILEDETESSGPILAYNRRGAAFTERALSQALTRLVRRLAESGKVRPNLTIHGLRHSRGTELAHGGASDAVLAAHLGHRDEQTAKEYRRQAEKRKLADEGQWLVDARRARVSPQRRPPPPPTPSRDLE